MQNVLYTIARILLGVLFVVFGLNGFLSFIPYPPGIPQFAGTFFGAMMQSHFAYFVFGIQLICGVLLLINRYMPLALVMLAAVLANVVAFHISMWPATLVPMPIVAIALWFVVAWRYRDKLNVLLQAT